MADLERAFLSHAAAAGVWQRLRVRPWGVAGLVVAALASGALLATTGSLASRGGERPSVTAAEEVAPTSAKAMFGLERVRVELYGMAGCPFTRGFIEGPLAETLATVPELVDFRFHPFGNSYYVTEACGPVSGSYDNYPFASYFKGYNQTVRECWDRRCGASAPKPAEDCFTGKLLCQHGATDGMVTTAWACAQAATEDNAAKYFPFVLCTAHVFLGITTPEQYRDAVGSCARAAPDLSEEAMLECATGPEGVQLYKLQARATVEHPAVPYVLVDGAELGDTKCVACGDGIMQKVCEASQAKNGVEQNSAPCNAILGVA